MQPSILEQKTPTDWYFCLLLKFVAHRCVITVNILKCYKTLSYNIYVIFFMYTLCLVPNIPYDNEYNQKFLIVYKQYKQL